MCSYGMLHCKQQKSRKERTYNEHESRNISGSKEILRGRKRNEQKELTQKFSEAIQKELYLVGKGPCVSLQMQQLDTRVGKMHH